MQASPEIEAQCGQLRQAIRESSNASWWHNWLAHATYENNVDALCVQFRHGRIANCGLGRDTCCPRLQKFLPKTNVTQTTLLSLATCGDPQAIELGSGNIDEAVSEPPLGPRRRLLHTWAPPWSMSTRSTLKALTSCRCCPFFSCGLLSCEFSPLPSMFFSKPEPHFRAQYDSR